MTTRPIPRGAVFTLALLGVSIFSVATHNAVDHIAGTHTPPGIALLFTVSAFAFIVAGLLDHAMLSDAASPSPRKSTAEVYGKE